MPRFWTWFILSMFIAIRQTRQFHIAGLWKYTTHRHTFVQMQNQFFHNALPSLFKMVFIPFIVQAKFPLWVAFTNFIDHLKHNTKTCKQVSSMIIKHFGNSCHLGDLTGVATSPVLYIIDPGVDLVSGCGCWANHSEGKKLWHRHPSIHPFIHNTSPLPSENETQTFNRFHS